MLVILKIVKDLIKHDKRFSVGLFVILIVLSLAILSFFSPYGPTVRRVVSRNLLPSFEHPLGTNSLGQDIFWKLTYAIRNSLILGILVSLISRIIATANGLLSGYVGGTTDRILSTITGSFIVIPRLPILILLSFSLRERMSILTLVIILAVLDWAWPSKRYRAQVLSLREREFTYTAVFSGMNTFKVVFKEHFLFLIPYMMADLISGFLWAIAMEITLSILGLSALATPTIGTMIYWANYHQALLRGVWWWISPPIIIAVLTVVALYMLSSSISEYLDPRTRLQRIGVKA
ncbi:peptide ABC transporter [Candidatus Aerophobetes bacterium Ae_b3a]|nr:MAG: peptide ABC transporter [Candidatus Aerophobetes bacterium Ae_b3a]